MSLRGGTTKQPRPVQYASDEVAALSLAMTSRGITKKGPAITAGPFSSVSTYRHLFAFINPNMTLISYFLKYGAGVAALCLLFVLHAHGSG